MSEVKLNQMPRLERWEFLGAKNPDKDVWMYGFAERATVADAQERQVYAFTVEAKEVELWPRLLERIYESYAEDPARTAVEEGTPGYWDALLEATIRADESAHRLR